MKSRKDYQLHLLGITKWILRRPLVLNGKFTISIPKHISLIIVSENLVSFKEPFVEDVLRTLCINSDQVLHLFPNQLVRLKESANCNSWSLGIKEKVLIKGSHIISPSLNELIINPDARKQLWKQICSYKHNFFTKVK